MRLLFAGDFNVRRGTGYATILENVCTELDHLGHDVIVLGDNWDKSEHHYPFRVIPTDYGWIPAQVSRLQQELGFDCIVLAMDVPKIVDILANLDRQGIDWKAPVAGLFPVESGPLLPIWAEWLKRLDYRFVISRFGQRVLADRGLESTFVPMTARTPEAPVQRLEARSRFAFPPALGNADLIRSAGLVALTVADNQERKDLPVIAEALADLQEQGTAITWALVTPVASHYGWHIPSLLADAGIADQTVVFQALPSDQLNLLYAACDFFVIASQAEGACLPLYEAMAHDRVCVAPAHTAIAEALEGRGILVEPVYRTVHPWGNVRRWHVAPGDLARAMASIEHPGNGALVDFIRNRPWSLAARIIEEALDG